MYPQGVYRATDTEMTDFHTNKSTQTLWIISDHVPNNSYKYTKEREYGYNEAIELAGSGRYTLGLLAALSLTLTAMGMDLFSFSVVVALGGCDLQLTQPQKQILLSIPFIGPIIMAYLWGFVSDTRGRRRCLLVATSVSCAMSALGALAPNWIVLAIFKLVGTCFSSCAQSVTYALLGESCAASVKGTYILVMTSVMHLSMSLYFAIAYFIGFLSFEWNLGFIVFVPWRLLVILLALPLGASAVALSFFYESPKFLINAGREAEALEVLANICKRNRGGSYPVKKVFLDEVGNVAQRSESLVGSLWQQTAPLFTPPLLGKTVLLNCLIAIIYSTSSSLFLWLPFLASDFARTVSSEEDQQQEICAVIGYRQEASSSGQVKCTSKIDLPIVLFTVAVGGTWCILNFLMSKLASRRKVLMILIFSFSGACCFAALHIPNGLVSTISFFGITFDTLCIGIVFSYCVDFYPTSFRGMAACLGVMVARVSSISGVNLISPHLTEHCSAAFYSLAAFVLSGALLSCFLPADKKL